MPVKTGMTTTYTVVTAARTQPNRRPAAISWHHDGTSEYAGRIARSAFMTSDTRHVAVVDMRGLPTRERINPKVLEDVVYPPMPVFPPTSRRDVFMAKRNK